MLPNLESRVSQVDTRMLILGTLLTDSNPYQAPTPYPHIQPLICSFLVVSFRFFWERLGTKSFLFVYSKPKLTKVVSTISAVMINN